ncbi:MAG: rod shape-determining protein MreC [Candidatus Paceibacterota bacterium]|jgi:rod shape-determining protein MreC
MTTSPKKNLAIAVSLIVVFFLTFNFILKPEGLKNFFYKNSSGVQRSFWDNGQAAIAFGKSYLSSWQIGQENQRLIAENQKLAGRIAELDPLARENDSLRQALELGLKEKFVLSPCQLVSKETSGDFVNVNAGKNQGIEQGQVVISQEGVLVGRVEQAYDDFSRVMLISDSKSAADVEVQDKGFHALARGQGGLKISLDLVDKDKDIKEGDLVITSALGGIFPPGIAFGRVSSAQKQAAASFLQVDVDLLFELDSLKYLFVIKNFKPLN